MNTYIKRNKRHKYLLANANFGPHVLIKVITDT